jgi:hypothetical protein
MRPRNGNGNGFGFGGRARPRSGADAIRQALLDGLDPYQRRPGERTSAYLDRTGGQEGLEARHPALDRAWQELGAVCDDLDRRDHADVPDGAFFRWAAAADPRFLPAFRAYLVLYADALAAEGFDQNWRQHADPDAFIASGMRDAGAVPDLLSPGNQPDADYADADGQGYEPVFA